MVLRFSFVTLILLALLLIPSFSLAQDDVSQTGQTVEFSIYTEPLLIALDTWDESKPPDSIKMEAYKIASGFLMGVPFHYEANRNKITINEQVDKVASDLKYLGTSSVEDSQRFDFSASVPYNEISAAKSGKSFPAHGEGDGQTLAAAREAARIDALDEAIRSAISDAYLKQSKPTPGMLDGRIMWYEITSEGWDEKSSVKDLYTMDLTAWVILPKQPATNQTTPDEQPPTPAEPEQ
jgi:hypothetical protein